MSVENKTFMFLVSWGLWLVMLSIFSKTRLGYVLLYYSLVLMILFVVVTEYKQLGPYITGIQSIGDFNKSINTTPAVPPVKGSPGIAVNPTKGESK